MGLLCLSVRLFPVFIGKVYTTIVQVHVYFTYYVYITGNEEVSLIPRVM